jgi:acetyl-CoA C-acetyltransferase
MSRSVYIAGIGMTKFGVLKESLIKLATESALETINDAGVSDYRIDRLVVGTQNPDEFTGIGHLSTLITDQLGLIPSGATRVETGPSSGSSAFEVGYSLIASGLAESVLVIGVEKMSHVNRSETSKILAKVLSYENEVRYGATPTALGALVACRYMYEYGLSRHDLSLVPVKAHKNGSKNQRAHFQNEITVADVVSSRIVATPLTLFDCCPTSDGAAAALLLSEKLISSVDQDRRVKILGLGHATDYHAIQHRQSLTSFYGTKYSSQLAFEMSKCTLNDIDVFELHDAFSILELINMEDIGLAKVGHAIDLVKTNQTLPDGKYPINTTGGLKARGHPTGASGLAQIHDIVQQLRGIAPPQLQVDNAKIGLTHNIGGFGNNMVVTILGRIY